MAENMSAKKVPFSTRKCETLDAFGSQISTTSEQLDQYF